MTDKLRQFIHEHREDFEIHQPREGLWEGVAERLTHNRRRMVLQRLAIAASLLLLITCGTWIFMENRPDTTVAETVDMTQPMTSTEVYFATIMQEKDAELNKYCTPQPDLCKEFERDITLLDEEYQQLKKEFAAAADKERILQAMMSNRQVQVQLISRQLQIMKSVKQKRARVKKTMA